MQPTYESITLTGTIVGRIWMPGIICRKEFRLTFTPDDRLFTTRWTGLRDALLEATRDGDFQACGLEEAALIIKRPPVVSVPSGSWGQQVWHCKVPRCKLTDDLWAEESWIEEYEEYDFSDEVEA